MATANITTGVDFNRKEILKELSEKGVAVIPNVLKPEECDKYIGQYKAWLDKFDEEGLKFESRRSLIQSYRIGHFGTTWEVRLSTKPVFAKLWNTEKLLTSADAVAISRPPEEGSEEYAMPNEDWFHLDQGAQRQGLHAFQGAIYLEETSETDHCFRVLEGSHKHHGYFFKAFPRADERTRKSEFYRLNQAQKSWYHKKGCKKIKVPCPKGGMILWDSRTVHDNCKPEFDRPNKDRWRFVNFVTMTPAIWAKPEDLAKKADAYHNLLITSHWASQGISTFKPYIMKKQEKCVTIETQPDIALTEEVRLLFGIESYDFEDGEPNGELEPMWALL